MMSEKERCAIQRIFSSDDGVIALRYLKNFAGVSSADFVADPRKADYMQGRRSVICEITNTLEE